MNNERDKYLDKEGTCFGWCKIEAKTPNDAIKNGMCSCRCSSWGVAGMAEYSPYNTAFNEISLAVKKERKSQKHKKRKEKV